MAPAASLGRLAYRRAASKIAGEMIYCVVPRPLETELYQKLVEYYKDEENVTVILDRRKFDRRARYGHSRASDRAAIQRRVVRDRRRARVPGDLPSLARVG
jgi:hypothetical protein